MSLKEELQKALPEGHLENDFKKLDERLVEKARKNQKWNRITLSDVAEFKEVNLIKYYHHLCRELGERAVTYKGMPVYEIVINPKEIW